MNDTVETYETECGWTGKPATVTKLLSGEWQCDGCNETWREAHIVVWAEVYWNGEVCRGRALNVVVPEWEDGDPLAAWWRPYVGTTRAAVLVEYHDQRHLLDNEDGSARRKVTEGRGSPRWGHKSLPIRSQEVRA